MTYTKGGILSATQINKLSDGGSANNPNQYIHAKWDNTKKGYYIEEDITENDLSDLISKCGHLVYNNKVYRISYQDYSNNNVYVCSTYGYFKNIGGYNNIFYEIATIAPDTMQVKDGNPRTYYVTPKTTSEGFES